MKECQFETRARYSSGEYYTQCDCNYCKFYGQECPGREECKEFIKAEDETHLEA